MKTLPSCICILGLAGLASTASGQLMDQIGADDGTNIDTSNILANQIFEASFSVYNIAVVDDYDNPSGTPAGRVEMAVGGWNGYAGIDGISGMQANMYSSDAAAGTSLVGDVASLDVAGTPVGSPDWTFAGYDVIGVDGIMAQNAGMNYVSLIPTNEFGVNGQTGVGIGFTGDLNSWQANPNGGFGFGAIQIVASNAAIRVLSGSSDPCDQPLGNCPNDIAGPNGGPDGLVAVDDILSVIGTFGECGDGTFRPVGDVNDDCCVNVDDLLAIVGAFGEDCLPRGACCFGVDGCQDDVKEADCSGDWLGEGSGCDECISGACCYTDGSCAFVYAPDCTGTFQGADVACADVTCGVAPDNNDCSGAIAIGDGQTNIANGDATSTGPALVDDCTTQTDPNIFNDLWYSYTASCDGQVTFSTCDSASFDTVIALYDACGGTQVACNDDGDGCGGFTSLLNYTMSSGDTVLVRVGSWSEGATGEGIMSIDCAVASPGACCVGEDCIDQLSEADCADFGGSFAGFGTDCADISCVAAGNTCEDALAFADGANAFDTTDASDSGFGEPDDTQCDGTFLDWTGSPDVWGSYAVASDGIMSVSLCDAASYDTSLVLYSGDCASATQIACNGDSSVETGCQSYYSGVYDLPVSAGDTILIRIGGWQGATGAGTCTISFVGSGATGACCVAGDCIGETTLNECESFGGLWNNGLTCAEVTCPAPYQAGGCDVDENVDLGCACFVDGDDSETDCNGGSNNTVPTFTEINLGESLCGTSSVFVDGPTGGTYRDLDWHTNAAINAGGNFDFTIGANSTCLILMVNLDAGTVDFTAAHEAGFVQTTNLDIPAGNWSAVATVSDWNTAWTCGSGFETYTMQVD